jgi:hypothetical protein
VASLDVSQWSGEGAFTQLLIDRLQHLPEIALVRVQDAPATRSDANYNFVSNEIFVAFATMPREQRVKLFRLLPATRRVDVPMLTISGLEQLLTGIGEVGAPDYADDGMIQYLRTERIVPPYQTRGYKLVELVRLYEARPAPADPSGAGTSIDQRSTKDASSS